MRRILTLALFTVMFGSAERAHANYIEDLGMGTATVGVNVIYMPAKVIYASLGGITGGFAYLLTGLNLETAENIWRPSLGGNYIVTPAHLRNEQTLYFSGVVESDAPPPPAADLAPPAIGMEPGSLGSEPIQSEPYPTLPN